MQMKEHRAERRQDELGGERSHGSGSGERNRTDLDRNSERREGGMEGGNQERLRRGEERRGEDRGLVEEDQSGREKVEATQRLRRQLPNMQPSAVDFAIENKHGRAQWERERGTWILIG